MGVSYYILATNITLVLSSVSGLVLRNQLDPEVFGAFLLGSTYCGYLSHVNTPIANLFDVQIPLIRGRNADGSELPTLISQSYRLQAWLLFGELSVLLALALPQRHVPVLGATLLTLTGSFTFTESTRLDRLLLKAHGHFRPLFFTSVGSALVSAVATISGGLAFGGAGYLAGYAIGVLTTYTVTRVYVVKLVRPQFRLRGGVGNAWRMVLGAGIALGLFRGIEQISVSVDRIFVERLLGLEDIGIYSLAVSLAGLAQHIPRSVAGGLLPDYLVRFDKAQAEAGHHHTLAYHEAVLWISVAVSLIAIVSAPLAVRWLFPRYAPAVLPAQILFAAGVVTQARSAPLVYLMGISKLRAIWLAPLVGLIASLAANAALVGAWGLLGAALATFVTFVIGYFGLSAFIEPSLRWALARTTYLGVGLCAGSVAVGYWGGELALYLCAPFAALLIASRLFQLLSRSRRATRSA